VFHETNPISLTNRRGSRPAVATPAEKGRTGSAGLRAGAAASRPRTGLWWPCTCLRAGSCYMQDRVGSGWHLAAYASFVGVGFSIAMARTTHGVSPGQWIGAAFVLFFAALFFIYKTEEKK
jgi:hypothetical protein